MKSRRLGKTGLFVSRLGLGLAALGRPGYINLGHADDLRRDYDAVLEELARMRGNGLRIGLTLSGTKQAETLTRALQVKVAGDRLFDSVQATWNLLEPSIGTALQAAHDAGMGVIVKEALANGRLTARYTDPVFAARRTRLEKEAARRQTTLDGLALAAAAAQPWAD